MIDAWLWTTLGLGGLLHAGFARWGRDWRLERASGAADDVAVLIPARNEEGNIGRCVAALSATSAARVVVVDDGSSDGTADEARAAGDARLELRTAAARPVGWSGKAWACTEAARGASERWLLFLDADVVVDAAAVRSAVARAERDDAAMLSLFGTWELVTIWERIAIPAIGWFIRGTLDLDDVNGAKDKPPQRAFANGQFVLVRRDAYERFGGHGAVRDAVLDDVGLAEVFRAAGARARMLWAPWAFRVRLYDRLGAIVQGYRKNLYAGMGRRPWLAALAVAFVFATGVAPLLSLPWWIGTQQWSRAMLASAAVVSAILLRWRTERRDGRNGAVALAEPAAAAVLCAVLAMSAVAPATRWKGRTFVDGRATD